MAYMRLYDHLCETKANYTSAFDTTLLCLFRHDLYDLGHKGYVGCTPLEIRKMIWDYVTAPMLALTNALTEDCVSRLSGMVSSRVPLHALCTLADARCRPLLGAGDQNPHHHVYGKMCQILAKYDRKSTDERTGLLKVWLGRNINVETMIELWEKLAPEDHAQNVLDTFIGDILQVSYETRNGGTTIRARVCDRHHSGGWCLESLDNLGSGSYYNIFVSQNSLVCDAYGYATRDLGRHSITVRFHKARVIKPDRASKTKGVRRRRKVKRTRTSVDASDSTNVDSKKKSKKSAQ